VELTNDDVADILALLDSLPYDEFDLRTDRFRLTLRRTPAGAWTEERQDISDPTPVAPATDGAGASLDSAPGGDGPISSDGTSSAGGAERGTRADGMASSATAGGDGLVPVLAPLPGTFYRAARPGAAPFVEVGDEVSADTVVAIVETMKLMNSVAAGTPGRVALIRAANGDFTPLGATLMLIEP
jgi:acetyl-CoA carboxylase biotin carboxyl carrier protein